MWLRRALTISSIGFVVGQDNDAALFESPADLAYRGQAKIKYPLILGIAIRMTGSCRPSRDGCDGEHTIDMCSGLSATTTPSKNIPDWTLPSVSRLRAYLKEECHEKLEKNVPTPGRLVARLLVSSASWAETKLEATILSFDGKDFVRTNTTLMDKGQSATNTKLDQIATLTKP